MKNKRKMTARQRFIIELSLQTPKKSYIEIAKLYSEKFGTKNLMSREYINQVLGEYGYLEARRNL